MLIPPLFPSYEALCIHMTVKKLDQLLDQYTVLVAAFFLTKYKLEFGVCKENLIL